jgi:Mlc titration factor MtfA (ptsG expression regulator)
VIARWLRPLRALRALRERRVLDRRAIPDDLWKRTLVRYPFLRKRDPADAEALRRLTSLFLDRKEFSTAGGMRLTDAMAVTIAAQAVLPVLHLGLERYDGFVGIVIHPDQMVVNREHQDEHGVVHEYEDVILGEAMEGGPLVLSWRDVRNAGRTAALGLNVVIHEFAHVLDLADGVSDGVPLLPREIPRTEWLQSLEPAYAEFVQRVEREEDTVLDPYAASGIDEFFAVASESFFIAAPAMRAEHPGLYRMLVRLYRQDPAEETLPARG